MLLLNDPVNSLYENQENVNGLNLIDFKISWP